MIAIEAARPQEAEYTAGGAVISAAEVIAWLGSNGSLIDDDGAPIGTYRHISTAAPDMHTIEATVRGRTYTGRSAGLGAVYRGKASL